MSRFSMILSTRMASTETGYYADAIHLSQRAMPLILEALRSQMLLDVPLKAAGFGENGDLRHGTAKITEAAPGAKVLIWCGVREIAKFIASRPNYDLCYVIEAEKALFQPVERLFRKDPGVRLFHLQSVNLLDFCRHQGIDKVVDARGPCGGSGPSIVKTIDRLIKKKRVSRIECEVLPDHGSKYSARCVVIPTM